jgi:hypothetical protein
MVIDIPGYCDKGDRLLLIVPSIGRLNWVQVIDSDDGSPEHDGRIFEGVTELRLAAFTAIEMRTRKSDKAKIRRLNAGWRAGITLVIHLLAPIGLTLIHARSKK